MDKMNVIIREARREDCQALMNMSKELDDFHKRHHDPRVDAKDLERDLFDVENSNMGIVVAEVNNNAVGYAHYYYLSTIRFGRYIYLEDLYIQAQYRNHKIGDKLMKAVAKKAAEQNLEKIELDVASWNPATKFYKRNGAVDLTETEKSHLVIFNKWSIEKIVSS